MHTCMYITALGMVQMSQSFMCRQRCPTVLYAFVQTAEGWGLYDLIRVPRSSWQGPVYG